MTPAEPSRIELRFHLRAAPAAAFVTLTERLVDGLRRSGIELEPRPHGALRSEGRSIGRVTAWTPAREVRFESRPVTWGSSPTVVVCLRLETEGSGSSVVAEVSGWDGVLEALGSGGSDWYGDELLPALVGVVSPTALGDWLTDRVARRPSGETSVANYRDPLFHWPNFLLILDRIHLTSDDRLLEVGCGGGAFLRKALESGCSAVAVDHSPEMVRLAQELNRGPIDEGRARVVEGDAGRLPCGDREFTVCVSTGAFGFFRDPLAALREMHRALVPGGRLAIFSGTAVLTGTPAAPEPLASRVRFYESHELAALAREAGFADISVEAPAMEAYALKAGLPDEIVGFFRGESGAQLLTARVPRSG